MSGAMEKPSTLKGESLSEARHNLRTLINHILGYGEMLMEDAEEQGKPKLVADLRQILEDGRLALAVINGALCPASNEVGEAEIRAMREAMLAPVGRILEKIRGVELVMNSGDVGKIRVAAERLLAMAGEILEPGGAAPVEPPAEI